MCEVRCSLRAPRFLRMPGATLESSHFPHVQAEVILIFQFGSVFLNAAYHIRLYFMTALIREGFWVAPAPLSPRSPGRTAAKLNLAFGNEFVHLICMQLGPTHPNFKGKWGLIFFKESDCGAAWSLRGSERLKLFRVSPPGFYKGKATQSGRDLTGLSIKDAASKPHSLQTDQPKGIILGEQKRVLPESALFCLFIVLSLDLLICVKGGFKCNRPQAWFVKPWCLSKLERDCEPTGSQAHLEASDLEFLR